MRPITPPEIPLTTAVVFGANQPEYSPLPARVDPLGAVVTEWEFEPDETWKLNLRAGLRVRIHILTRGQPLQPLRVELLSPSE
jgi:hypothetical protein